MYDFFDRHGKKFLAVVGSLLVLVFLMPSGMGRGGGTARRYGTIGGVQLKADDIAQTQAGYASVLRLAIANRSRQSGGGLMTLPQAIIFPTEQFGPLAQKLEQNPLLFHLLVREAQEGGISDDEQQLDSILSSPNVFLADTQPPVSMKDVNPALRDTFRAGLSEIVAVRRFFERRRAAIKFTQPMIDDAVARQTEQIRVRVASFAADRYASEIAAPTDEELRAQLDAYANDAPGAGNPRNPFGFGYKIADKLQLQWIAVPKAEVARAVEASKTAELWDEDSIIYYQKHPQLFQIEAKTPPTTAPAAAPTTRPFAEVKADVLKKLREPLIDQLQRQIANRVVQQMTVDTQRAREHAATTQQAADGATGFGVALGSYEYLQKLADDIQKQFGVKISTTNQALPLTKIELQAIGGIGATTPADISSAAAMNEVTGPAYLFELCKPLMASADRGRLGAFDLLQPSKILAGDDSLYVARAISAEPSHPPRGLDEVRSAVAKDVREKLAFAKAADAAQNLVNAAPAAGGIEKATGASDQNKPQTSDWFGAESSEVTGVKDIDDAFQVVGPMFDLLRGLKSPGDLPRRTVIKRQAKGTALAVELFDVRTTLNTANSTEQQMRALQASARELVSPLRDFQLVSDWFSMDGVSRRVGFVPEAGNKPAAPAASVPLPGNPFVPG